MPKAEQTPVAIRIVIDRPVAGVLHSLQSGDATPLDPKASHDAKPLTFDFTVRVADGQRFFGDQVRREGSQRRFVYIRVGELAGDTASPWSRRMKIDIHDIDPALLARAAAGDGAIGITIDGTGRDGTPACATVSRTAVRIV